MAFFWFHPKHSFIIWPNLVWSYFLGVEVTNVQEAKTHLSRLLERVKDGNEILIGKAVKPIAKLVPFSPSDQPRQIGGWEN